MKIFQLSLALPLEEIGEFGGANIDEILNEKESKLIEEKYK